MRTGLNPLRDGLFGNAALTVAERADVSAGITPDTLAQLPGPILPAFFYGLGVDVRRLAVPLSGVDLGLLDLIAYHDVTPLGVALLTHRTLAQERVSLTGTRDAYQHDILALDHVLAQEDVYGPKVAALDNNTYFTHTAYGLLGEIHGQIAETTVVEHEVFGLLAGAREHGGREF
jgi:hypothetical protein